MEFDATNSAIGPAFDVPGFTAPAVMVRIWQSPGPGSLFPAAMFAEFFLAKGTEDASAISIDLASATTIGPSSARRSFREPADAAGAVRSSSERFSAGRPRRHR
ncbi:MAG: hypothetical protein ABIO83_08540 [Ilumatobacteraceae bacterium]